MGGNSIVMIAILAFGSLIDSPGAELQDTIIERRSVTTPFSVEFARLSKSRGGAPTLVPVSIGGAQIQGMLLLLGEHVSLEDARDMLYRRETNQIAAGSIVRRRFPPRTQCELNNSIALLTSTVSCSSIFRQKAN